MAWLQIRIVHVYTAQLCIHHPWSLKKYLYSNSHVSNPLTTHLLFSWTCFCGNLPSAIKGYPKNCMLFVHMSKTDVDVKQQVFFSYQHLAKFTSSMPSHVLLLFSGVLWVLLWSICRRAEDRGPLRISAARYRSQMNKHHPQLRLVALDEQHWHPKNSDKCHTQMGFSQKKANPRLQPAAWNLGITFCGSNPNSTRIQETWAILEIPSSWYMSPVCSDVCVCVLYVFFWVNLILTAYWITFVYIILYKTL